MADAGYTGTDVELVAKVFITEAKKNPVDTSSPYSWGATTRVLFGPNEFDIARAVLSALAATGRLVDPNAETRTEWASEHSGHGAANFPDPMIFETGSDRRLAEVRVETWRASHPPATHRLLCRQVTTTRGPWLPAPTTGTEDTP